MGYFAIAPSRVPSFEEWGIALKVLQGLLLGALVCLAVRGSPRRGAQESAQSG